MNFIYKKRFGQNFLIDNNILDKIIKESNIEPNSLVIEIGVGSGNLTKKLLESDCFVLGYEVDLSLKDRINEIKNDKFFVIFDDFLKRDIKEDIKKFDFEKLYVIANLPYNITTPILSKLIKEDLNIKKMVLMVQEEVGDRFVAVPKTKKYNSLSVFLQYNYEIKKLFKVSRNCFYPIPNVDSLVLGFKPSSYKVKDEEKFYKLVEDSFAKKRKTLKNNLINYDFKKICKEFGFKENIRAEEISIETFIEISNFI